MCVCVCVCEVCVCVFVRCVCGAGYGAKYSYFMVVTARHDDVAHYRYDIVPCHTKLHHQPVP